MPDSPSSAVCIARFSTPAEAHVVLTRLQSAGFHAAIQDEFTVQFNWPLSDAIGGVKIIVPAAEEADARAILALPPSEPGVLVCPHCGSSDTRVRVLSVFGAICMVFKLPIPMTRAVVDCRSCRRTFDAPLRGGPDVDRRTLP
jgi:hypothetical protein